MKTNLILDESLAFFALSECRTFETQFRRKRKLFNLRARICTHTYKQLHMHEVMIQKCNELLVKIYTLDKNSLLRLVLSGLSEWKEKVKERVKKSDFGLRTLNDSWLLADGITGGTIYENE